MKINQSLFLPLLIMPFITSVTSGDSFFKKHKYVIVGSCSALLGFGILACRYYPWSSKSNDKKDPEDTIGKINTIEKINTNEQIQKIDKAVDTTIEEKEKNKEKSSLNGSFFSDKDTSEKETNISTFSLQNFSGAGSLNILPEEEKQNNDDAENVEDDLFEKSITLQAPNLSAIKTYWLYDEEEQQEQHESSFSLQDVSAQTQGVSMEKDPLVQMDSEDLRKEGIRLPKNFVIDTVLKPIIDRWTMQYGKEEESLTWNPMALVLRIYEVMDPYDFYQKDIYPNNNANAGRVMKLAIFFHVAKGIDAEQEILQRYIHQGAEGDVEFTLEEEAYKQHFSEIEPALQQHGKYFLPAIFKQSSTIMAQSYEGDERELLTSIMKLSLQKQERLLSTEITKLREDKQNANINKRFIDFVTNKIAVVCEKFSSDLDQNIIASTDSQGSFDPLIPIGKLKNFFQLKNQPKDSLVTKVHCGDHVDRFGDEGSAPSNWLQFLAYHMMRASEVSINALFNRYAGFNRMHVALPPGNHDTWHFHTVNHNHKEWEPLQKIIEEGHMEATGILYRKLRIYYLLSSFFMPKTNIIEIECCDPKQGNRMQSVIHAQHSCFLQPGKFGEKHFKVQKGSWISILTRVQSNDKPDNEFNTMVNQVKKRFPRIVKQIFVPLKEDKSFLLPKVWQINEEKDTLITYLHVKDPTLWCDFNFMKARDEIDNRGFFVHNTLLLFLGYLFITINNYEFSSDTPNFIMFFGHSHNRDQESVRLTNYFLKSSPCSLNMVFDKKEEKNLTFLHLQQTIKFHKNKPQNPLFYKGIYLLFLPVHPMSDYAQFRNALYMFNTINNIAGKKNIAQETIDIAQETIDNDMTKNNYQNDAASYLDSTTFILSLPTYVILSKKCYYFASIGRMKKKSLLDLFDPAQQELPVEIVGDQFDPEKNYDPQIQ